MSTKSNVQKKKHNKKKPKRQNSDYITKASKNPPIDYAKLAEKLEEADFINGLLGLTDDEDLYYEYEDDVDECYERLFCDSTLKDWSKTRYNSVEGFSLNYEDDEDDEDEDDEEDEDEDEDDEESDECVEYTEEDEGYDENDENEEEYDEDDEEDQDDEDDEEI